VFVVKGVEWSDVAHWLMGWTDGIGQPSFGFTAGC